MQQVFEIDYQIEDINQIATKILGKTSSKILLFEGEMGSGKTTLIKSLVNNMVTKDTVGSPTFSLVNEYDTERGIIYHFDLYRIENKDELLDLGFEDYLDKGSWVFIEWPEKAEEYLQLNYNRILLKVKKNSTRNLKLITNPN